MIITFALRQALNLSITTYMMNEDDKISPGSGVQANAQDKNIPTYFMEEGGLIQL